MQFVDYGERAFLWAGLDPYLQGQFEARMESTCVPGLQEWVRGFNTLLLICHSAEMVPVVQAYLQREMGAAVTAKIRKRLVIEVPVRYTGADLDRVAEQVGLSCQDVIELHAAPEYRVHTMGFMPGFPYLTGLDPRLHLDRMASPRTSVPAGSVAIGGAHAGIYSVASPGGWHLLGQTDFSLFDLEAAQSPSPQKSEVFALDIGDRLRFVPIV